MRKLSAVLLVSGLAVLASVLPAGAGGTVTKPGRIQDAIRPGQAQIYQINVPAWQPATVTITSDGRARYNFMVYSWNGLVLGNSNGAGAVYYFNPGPAASYRIFVTDMGGPALSPLVVQVR